MQTRQSDGEAPWDGKFTTDKTCRCALGDDHCVVSGNVWWRAAVLAAPILLVILTELLIRVTIAILNDVFRAWNCVFQDLRQGSGPAQ